jgi:aerobic-type carbon monoxide dehydrogenase small subunit (CoxS/CutS family)
MAERISFTVNGAARSVELEGWEKAIDVLRETLGLTGTKRGCDDASCGACTIVVDGVAKKGCVLPAKRLDGTTVLTIEGMARGTTLHPIQEALIEAGAVQCGYCIPGIVMTLHALFTATPAAAEEKIVEALSRHLCRCTGYEALLEGARLAQNKLAGTEG